MKNSTLIGARSGRSSEVPVATRRCRSTARRHTVPRSRVSIRHGGGEAVHVLHERERSTIRSGCLARHVDDPRRDFK